jgi:hypothetical protein
MVWGKAGSTTLSNAGDDVDITSLSESKFRMIISHMINSGACQNKVTFNNVSTQKYATRNQYNDDADSTQINQSLIPHWDGNDNSSTPQFVVSFLCDVDGEEKIGMYWGIDEASDAPKSRNMVYKHLETAKITRLDLHNQGAGSYNTGSNLTVLGSDLTPASAVTFPTNVQVGSRAEITDTRKIYFRMDSGYTTDKWFELGTVPYAGGRGVFAGGYSGSNYNTIEYITISTTGNTTAFGDLTRSVRNGGVCANQLRGIYCGGYDSGYSDDIEYITIQTPSNATTFGTFGDTATNGMMGIGSETRALFGGGETSMTDRIDYLTIATPSNSTSFGNLSVSRKGGGTTGDGTKGIFMGGEEGGQHGTTMDYVTIDANPTVTATDWGDLDIGTASASVGLISNGTIGLLAVGVGYSNRVDKKTIATNANSSDYGDLTVGRQQGAQCSTETRGVFGGGKTAGGSNYTNTIDYMTIASGGTSTDFGDLSNARYILGGMSDTGAVRS